MYEKVREIYRRSGFGGKSGFGSMPALLVIDLARSWIDQQSPIGSNLGLVITNTCRLLRISRKNGIPIFFTTMTYDNNQIELLGPMGNKLQFLKNGSTLTRGSKWVELDSRLERKKTEFLIEKQRASAFWGTPLLSYLIARKVDTIIITGCSTSGCIRSTAESAHNLNLHTIVVEEAVSDRSILAHECNLIDIDLRYADVVHMNDVGKYLLSKAGTIIEDA